MSGAFEGEIFWSFLVFFFGHEDSIARKAGGVKKLLASEIGERRLVSRDPHLCLRLPIHYLRGRRVF